MKSKLLILLTLFFSSLQFHLFADNEHLQQIANGKQELNLFVANYVAKEDQIAIKADTLFCSDKIPMDIVVLSRNLIFYFAQQGKLLPVNELFDEIGFDKDDRTFINQAGDEKVYGIPSLYENTGLYYNEKHFKKANLPIPWEPKNWADVERAIAQLRKIPDIYPILMNIQKAFGIPFA